MDRLTCWRKALLKVPQCDSKITYIFDIIITYGRPNRREEITEKNFMILFILRHGVINKHKLPTSILPPNSVMYVILHGLGDGSLTEAVLESTGHAL